MARPSALHGVHWPHDSTARKRATPAATAVMSVPSPTTMRLAVPSPLPAAAMSS